MKEYAGQPGYGYNGPKKREDAFTQQIFGHNILITNI